jgi:hypothetical protein
MTLNHTGSRNCSRCGRDLTDAASMDRGIGPVCRKMDNHVLARMIPSNAWAAQRCWASIDAESVPEAARQTLGQIGADLLIDTNDDWRTTCKRVEWIISWGVTSKTKQSLVNVVRALGYVGLASLLVGEAAKGLCTVAFENGRLFYQGPRHKAARLATKKIAGWQFHAAKGETKARWSVPAAAYAVFQTLIWNHYPKNSGLQEAVEAAQAHASKPVVETAPVAPAPTVSVTEQDGVLKVKSPFNKGFISTLKSEIKTWKHRRWNPEEKVWEVHPSHAATLQALIAQFYGEEVVLAA